MKRIVAFIFVVAISALVYFATKGENFSYDGLEKVCFVCSDALTEQNFADGQDVSVVQSGAQFFVTVNPENARQARQKIEALDGYVLHFNKSVNLNDLKKQFFDFSDCSYRLGDYEIVEGYTNKFGDFCDIKGKRYNAQLAVTPDEIIVGFPTILTGF